MQRGDASLAAESKRFSPPLTLSREEADHTVTLCGRGLAKLVDWLRTEGGPWQVADPRAACPLAHAAMARRDRTGMVTKRRSIWGS
jgi:hypothetical protein